MSNVFRKIDEISEKLDYVTTAVFIMEENFENLDLIDFSLRDNLFEIKGKLNMVLVMFMFNT